MTRLTLAPARVSDECAHHGLFRLHGERFHRIDDLIARAFRLGKIVFEIAVDSASQGVWYQPGCAVLASSPRPDAPS